VAVCPLSLKLKPVAHPCVTGVRETRHWRTLWEIFFIGPWYFWSSRLSPRRLDLAASPESRWMGLGYYSGWRSFSSSSPLSEDSSAGVSSIARQCSKSRRHRGVPPVSTVQKKASIPAYYAKGPCVDTASNKHSRDRDTTHRFPVGTYVLHRVHFRSRKEAFQITRLLPDTGAGFQYRIKAETEGFERVVTEPSLEAAGDSFCGESASSPGTWVPEKLAALLESGSGPPGVPPVEPRRKRGASGRRRIIPRASIAGSNEG